MNKVILMGRLTKNPEIRYSQGADAMAIANYTLAVERSYKRDNESQTADFISCVAFQKQAEFAEKFLRQGIKIVIVGRIQSGSYTNNDGKKILSFKIIIESQEFAESKKANPDDNSNGFMNIPDDLDMPFS